MAQTLQDELKSRKTEIQGRLRRVRQERAALSSLSVGGDFHQVDEAAPHEPEIAHLRQVEASIARQLDTLNLEIEQDRRRIKKLRYWLNIEAIGGVSIAGTVNVLPFVIPLDLVYILLAMAAIAFLPLLLGTLIRSKRRGWLVLFVVMVILPCALPFLPVEKSPVALLLRLTPLLLFYLYCWSLRLASDDWGEY